MRNLLSILCFLLPFLVVAQTNNPKCFILKSDITGFERKYETDLNPISCEIATLLGKPDSFKVFDYGLYLHLTNIIGAVEDVMIRIKDASAKDSKYYMTITKIPSYDKVIERFDVKLKLPQTGVFTCLNSTKIGLIQERISQKINAYHKSHQTTDFKPAIEEGLKELKATIQAIKSGNCCPLTEKEIQEMLFAEGFVAVPIGNISDNSTNFNPYDYAQVTYNGENIAKRLNEITTGFPTQTSYHTYVTDNDNICNDTFFQQAKREYSESLADFDVWFHIFKASNGKKFTFLPI
jgi:hypothetical protein